MSLLTTRPTLFNAPSLIGQMQFFLCSKFMAPFLLTEKIVSGDLEGTQALEVLSEMKLTVIDTFF